MKKSKKAIIDYLDELFLNPACELTYNKDYELLIKVVLSSQTTDKKVNKVGDVLFGKYSSLNELKDASVGDIRFIIRELGMYQKKSENIIKIADILLHDCNSIVPNNREILELMPGVGRKTANVVLGELFNENVLAVDTHVIRVSNRLELSKSINPIIVEKDLIKYFKSNLNIRHKQLVLFGRYHCKAIRPECDSCKLKDFCKRN